MEAAGIQKWMRALAAALVSTATLLVPAGWAQSGGDAANGNMQRMDGLFSGSTDDKDFLKSALQEGMAQVQLGQLAAQKASSDDVKQFGRMMVEDHTRLDDQMMKQALQLGVRPAKDLSKRDKELMAKLQGLSGTQFDDAYIAAAVKGHQKSADDFKNEAGITKSTSLKPLVQQGEEVTTQHLQMIDTIARNHHLMNDKGKLVSPQ